MARREELTDEQWAIFRAGCFPERSDSSAKPRQDYEAVSRRFFFKARDRRR